MNYWIKQGTQFILWILNNKGNDIDVRKLRAYFLQIWEEYINK